MRADQNWHALLLHDLRAQSRQRRIFRSQRWADQFHKAARRSSGVMDSVGGFTAKVRSLVRAPPASFAACPSMELASTRFRASMALRYIF